MTPQDVERHILDKFAEVASSIGYSPLHGKIIGALLVRDKPMSLQEVAQATGYSSSMVSLSLDLLEVLSVIRKIKKTGDRKLYIAFQGDLLDALKKAILMRVEKSIASTIAEFEESKKQLAKMKGEDRERVVKTLTIFENEVKRLNHYVTLFAKFTPPQKS
jgi:DNA-binding transcriptional regulator GbsR (MarR family)